ncbi:MAG: PAS domain S-box protein [Prolixibacteraceae bacterium]|nr:PAS domain S-box protein [Prolixibacteraceae bacterium]
MRKDKENTVKENIHSIEEENKLLIIENDRLRKSISENIFSKAKAISSVGYWTFSNADKSIALSEEIYNLFEIPASTDLSDYHAILNLLHPADQKTFIPELKKKLAKEDVLKLDARIIVPDGSIKYVSIKVLVERDNKQQLKGLTGTVTDITEAHFKAEKSKNNEELFRNLFDNLTDIFFILEGIRDNEGNITDYVFLDVNPVFEMKFSLKKEEITGKNFSILTSVFQQLHPLFKLTALTNQAQQDRLFIQMLDSFFDVLIYSPSENLIATIWRDVSLIVEADSALRESEEKYRQIFSIGSDALFLVDYFSGKIIDVNPTAAKMFGYKKDHLLKIPFKELSASTENFEKQIIEQKMNLINEVFKKSDGTNFPVEASLSYFNWNGRKVLVASFRDISERLNAQEELIKSEQKFKQLFDYSNDAVLIIKNYRIIDFNQKSVTLFKLKSDQLINKTLWNLSPSKQSGGEDSRTKAVEFIQNSLLGIPLQFEWVFERPDRTSFFADIKLSPIVYGNENVIQAIVRDISPQKETQIELTAHIERWKTALEAGSIGVWDWDIITNEIYFSPVWKKIIGYENNEIPNQFNEFEKRIHPDDIAHVYNSIDKYLLSKIPNFSIVFRLRCKNGTYKWIHSEGKIFSYTSEGKPNRFIGTHVDITKQKIYEENLISHKENLKDAVDNASIGYWELNLHSMVMNGPEETFALFGFKNTQQVSIRQIEKLINPEDQKFFISQFISSGVPSKMEQIFRINMEGETKYFFSKSHPIFNSKNILVGYKGFFQEVTQFKKQELEVKDEQRLLKTMSEKQTDSVVISLKEEVIYSNEKYAQLTGYSAKDIITRKISPFMVAVPEDRILINQMHSNIKKNPSGIEKADIRLETKNNRIKWVELRVTGFPHKNENGLIYSMTDITQRKSTELKLIESEKLQNKIIENSQIGYALLNNTGKLIINNKIFNEITDNDNTNQGNSILPDTINNTEISNEISKGIELITFKIKPVYTNEFVLTSKNNIWVKLSLSPIYDKNNEIQYFIIQIEDIDQQVKLTGQLEKNIVQNKLMFDSIKEGIGLINSKNELYYGNNALLKLLDINLKHNEQIHINSIPALSPLTKKINVLKTGETFESELRLPGHRIVNAKLTSADISGSKECIVSLFDVTESKNEFETIKTKFEKYQRIFDLAPLGMALIDKNRQITLANEQYAKLFNYKPNDLLFIKIDELVTTEHLSEIITKLSQLFTGLTISENFTNQMMGIDGKRKWVNTNLSAFKDPFGDIEYAIQIVHDITDYKTKEHSILTNERLQTLNHIANSFAHEFNNILMSIYGTSYLIKNNLTDQRFIKYAENLFLSTQRATDLTRRLLSFSADSNKISVLVDFNELIESIISEFEFPSNIHINYKPSTQKERIPGDPAQLKQAIQNIIQNAVDALQKGGTITIAFNTVYFETTFSVNKTESAKGKFLRLIVSDTGDGIDENILAKIFDPFFSTKEYKYKSGLGLTISREIINAHHGSIKVFSEPGKGTNVNIYLPQSFDETTASQNQPDEQGIVKGSANILLIDDEDMVRIITSELLNELGYDVYSFASGNKALNFFTDNYSTIDLVILDMYMPEIDGTEVYEKMKGIHQGVKVILLTGYTISDEIKNTFISENSGIIQKPVSIEKLSHTISEILYK